MKVYPRPRGGAPPAHLPPDPLTGLSPPTRGSRGSFGKGGGCHRSIPAHAGEPPPGATLARSPSVYPRPRGGAPTRADGGAEVQGLSPPTRGSQYRMPYAHCYVRSIPAHAGEPPGDNQQLPTWRVYPRPRGGASAAIPQPQRHRGLSPPTRGSRLATARNFLCCGSIPAHAGEPEGARVRNEPHKVYPRPRGGASPWCGPRCSPTGLSPPTRGSRLKGTPFPLLLRSIPAHAGEPVAFPGRRPILAPRQA